MGSVARPFVMDVPTALVLLGVFFLLSAQSRMAEQSFVRFFRRGPWVVRAGFTVVLALALIECGPSGVPPFIYFQY